jgi:hypothetical protein
MAATGISGSPAVKVVDRALAVNHSHDTGGTELPACAPLIGAAEWAPCPGSVSNAAVGGRR